MSHHGKDQPKYKSKRADPHKRIGPFPALHKRSGTALLNNGWTVNHPAAAEANQTCEIPTSQH
jgi:hypothetical protein